MYNFKFLVASLKKKKTVKETDEINFNNTFCLTQCIQNIISIFN